MSEFKPSRSQRRALQRNSGIDVVIQPPTVTAEHLNLFNAYHRDMHFRRGWPLHEATEEIYRESYLLGAGTFAREFLYFQKSKLVGVGLLDALHEGSSSVYFFHDPSLRSQALGVFSILQQLRFASELGLRHHYLGYWVAECPSMAYKSQYRPHEILTRYPEDDEEPNWARPEGVSMSDQ